MLSKSASNALLKTLEEPPDHVVFVLATTDPQKLLPTIRSRTQHFEVHLLDSTQLTELVDQVDADAELGASDEVKRWAVRSGAGSARDTLSALERAVALGGVPDALTEVDTIINAFGANDTATALTAVGNVVRAGRNPQDVGNELIERLRNVFLTAMGAPPTDLPSEVIDNVTAQAGVLGARGATHALEVLGHALAGIIHVPDPRVPLELAVVRITQPQLDTSTSALLGRIEKLEKALATGAPVAGPGAGPGALADGGPAAAPPAARQGPPSDATTEAPDDQAPAGQSSAGQSSAGRAALARAVPARAVPARTRRLPPVTHLRPSASRVVARPSAPRPDPPPPQQTLHPCLKLHHQPLHQLLHPNPHPDNRLRHNRHQHLPKPSPQAKAKAKPWIWA